MKRLNRSLSHRLAIAAACAACIACERTGGRTTVARSSDDSPGGATPVTTERLVAAASDPDNWLTYGRDYANQRYSPLAQINTENVGRIAPVWIHSSHPVPRRFGGRAFKQESTPIVADGVLYYTYPGNLVMALEAATGRELWRYQARLGPVLRFCCGPNNRGVALFDGRVYMATLDARVIALDAKTGVVVWDTRAAEPAEGYSFTLAPIVADGKVIVGVAGGEFSIRGFVDAYDARTGERVWRFWTVPSPEEGGWWGKWATTTPEGDDLHRDIARERADSAKYPDTWQQGGAPVWTTPSYDPALGLVFFGTGNPSAPLDDNDRPGDNLYNNSIVAVDVNTGKRRWHYQMVPHDVWDYDASNPTLLLDVDVGGKRVPAVAHAGKTGWVYVLDRRTGNRILRSEAFVPHRNMFVPPPTDSAVRIEPHGAGGANWMPTSYSPRTGWLYVTGQHVPSTYQARRAERIAGQFQMGGSLKFPSVHRRWGTMVAIDPATGRIRWQKNVDHPKDEGIPMYGGGSLATAGDLIFFGDPDGFLNALDARTGTRLWRFQSGADVRATPITYRIGGRQYVALASREVLLAFALPEPP